jgi:hypothetical protein
MVEPRYQLGVDEAFGARAISPFGLTSFIIQLITEFSGRSKNQISFIMM